MANSTQCIEDAVELLARAADLSIEWAGIEDLWSKINELLTEAKAATEDLQILKARISLKEQKSTVYSSFYSSDYSSEPEVVDIGKAHALLREELGELLFAVIDICRILQVDPRAALEIANKKFEASLSYIEDTLAQEGRIPALEDPERIRQLWEEGKKIRIIKSVHSNPISSSVSPTRSVSVIL
jgi:uncharacterized protein YabN with tetrapyrrole methylase and pyrophosphatase domain